MRTVENDFVSVLQIELVELLRWEGGVHAVQLAA